MSSAPLEPRECVFLSYGRSDAATLAARLRADLERNGYRVWQDARDLAPGIAWEDQIDRALGACAAVLALLSPHSVRRAEAGADLDSVCLDELALARYRYRLPILPVMVVPCEAPLTIARLQRLDGTAAGRSEDDYQRLLAEVLAGLAAASRGEVRYQAWDAALRPLDDLFAPFLWEKRLDFCGREWLFREIDAWRSNPRERALLILGDPGVGKSAVVAELVHRNPNGQVLAYHCCRADVQDTLQPARFVRSLAAMIAARRPDYADRLRTPDLEEALDLARCAADPGGAFEAGLLAPLAALPPPAQGTCYLLIDALDEVLSLPTGPTIVDVLAGRLERLPGWLRLVATSRQNPAVRARLAGLRAREIDADDADNRRDLAGYVGERLARAPLVERLRASGRSADAATATLCDKAAGNFLYARQALDGLERDQHTFADLDRLPPGLSGLYDLFFRRHFPDPESYRPARAVLEAALGAYEPLGRREFAAAADLDPDGEFLQVMRPLASFLPERDGRHAVYHRSLADWLTETDGPYRVAPRHGLARLTDMTWRMHKAEDDLPPYTTRFMPRHLAKPAAGTTWPQR